MAKQAMATEVVTRPKYEEVFEVVGGVVCILAGLAGTVFLIYWLLIAPYERQKEVLNKLESLQYSLSSHEAYNANMHTRKD